MRRPRSWRRITRQKSASPPSLSNCRKTRLQEENVTAVGLKRLMSTAKNLGALWGLAFTLAATGWAQPLTLSSPPLPFGTIGANYSTNVSATGGSGNYHFAVVTGNLPPGLQIADTGSAPPIMGHIFGAPTTGGTYNFTIKVSDSQTAQTGTQAYSIGVMQISTPAALPGADAGTMYSLQFQATDAPGPFSWSAPGAPAGMSMSTSGLFSAIRAQPGVSTFNVTAVSPNMASATIQATFKVLQS